MNPKIQKALLQSELNRENAELRLMHSGHRLGPTPSCPQIGDLEEAPPQETQVVNNTDQSQAYFDYIKTEEPKKDNKLKNALLAGATSLGILGGSAATYWLNSKPSTPKPDQPQIQKVIDDKEGDWLGSLRRKGDNLPPTK